MLVGREHFLPVVEIVVILTKPRRCKLINIADVLPFCRPVHRGAGTAGIVRYRARKARICRAAPKRGFPAARMTDRRHPFAVDMLVSFKVIEHARRAPRPRGNRRPGVALSALHVLLEHREYALVIPRPVPFIKPERARRHYEYRTSAGDYPADIDIYTFYATFKVASVLLVLVHYIHKRRHFSAAPLGNIAVGIKREISYTDFYFAVQNILLAKAAYLLHNLKFQTVRSFAGAYTVYVFCHQVHYFGSAKALPILNRCDFLSAYRF